MRKSPGHAVIAVLSLALGIMATTAIYVSLRLDRDVGTRLQEKQMLREKLDWTATIDLPAGTYSLTEAGHQNWVYRLVITERQTR